MSGGNSIILKEFLPMKRKILAVVLAVMMLACALPFGASAANDGYIHEEILNNDNYYHMEYVEKENYFKNQFTLYTALGFYDNAWYNYFDSAVDINYAKAILLGLIEQVEAEYNNETFEEVMKILGKAEGAMEVITKVGEISEKVTDALEFTQSAEWLTTLGVLNTAIKAGNYANEVYEAYVKGYAMILSAKAASAYYGDFLTYLVKNCKNEDVAAAAAEIAETIDAELQASVDALIQSLVADAGKDAASLAAEMALDSYGVTAAIKGAYKTVVSISDKLFNTKDKYEFMMSLVETYYIEDCFADWASAAFDSENADFASFAESTVIAVRATGEQLLANLAQAKTKALVAMVKQYDTTELKVKAAVALAKLDAAGAILADDKDDAYVASAAVTGKTDLALNKAGTVDTIFAVSDETAVAPAYTAAGAYANVYSDVLGEYIKVAYLLDGAYDIVLSGAARVATTYAVIADKYACVDTTEGRVVTFKDILAAPSIVVADADKEAVTLEVSDTFVAKCDPSVAVKAGTGSSSGSSSSGSSSSSPKFDFGKIFSDFFQSIIDAFKSIFNIFKK